MTITPNETVLEDKRGTGQSRGINHGQEVDFIYFSKVHN